MTSFLAGVFSGSLLGAAEVLLLLAMPEHDTGAPLLAAFLNRFGIGLVIPALRDVTWPGWLIGVVFGTLMSLPYAIFTGRYELALAVGATGGCLVGGLTRGWRATSPKL